MISMIGEQLPMLVTFHTKGWSSITMFGDVAVTLLKMAGHTGTVPGALLAGDIRPAIARLKEATACADPNGQSKQNVPSITENAETMPVGLRSPAYPLIELLIAAARQHCDVSWER